MGTLWLGGAEGLIAQNCTQITGADTGFPEGGDFTSTPPPLDIVCVKSFALRKIEKHGSPLLDIHKHPPPPLDIVRVTSSALRKIEKHPPPLPPLLLPQKRTAAAQKTELPKSWGGCSPPAPPASYAYGYISHIYLEKVAL